MTYTETTMHGFVKVRPQAKHGGATKTQLRNARKRLSALLGRKATYAEAAEYLRRL